VNKYLHTVASVGFLFALNYDARSLKFILNTSLDLRLDTRTRYAAARADHVKRVM